MHFDSKQLFYCGLQINGHRKKIGRRQNTMNTLFLIIYLLRPNISNFLFFDLIILTQIKIFFFYESYILKE